MKEQRNIITLSHMDRHLEEWAREEAKRRGKHFYQIVNEAVEEKYQRERGQCLKVEVSSDPQ